jgi:hypothetical protein
MGNVMSDNQFGLLVIGLSAVVLIIMAIVFLWAGGVGGSCQG